MGCTTSTTTVEENVSDVGCTTRSPHSAGSAQSEERTDPCAKRERAQPAPQDKGKGSKCYRERPHRDDPRSDWEHIRSSSISTCVSPPSWLAGAVRVPSWHSDHPYPSQSTSGSQRARAWDRHDKRQQPSAGVKRGDRRASARERKWISDTMWETVRPQRRRAASTSASTGAIEWPHDSDPRVWDTSSAPVRFRPTRSAPSVWLGFGDSAGSMQVPQYFGGDAEVRGASAHNLLSLIR